MSNPDHKAKVVGFWAGMVIERTGDKYPFRIKIEATDPNAPDFPVHGKGEVELEGHGIIPMLVKGQFRQGTQYLQIDYSNEDPGIIHFGTALLELSREGTEIEGEFIGCSPVDEDIIAGAVALRKKNPA